MERLGVLVCTMLSSRRSRSFRFSHNILSAPFAPFAPIIPFAPLTPFTHSTNPPLSCLLCR